MAKIEKIFLHHSASEFGDAKIIETWHKDRGWSGIGYHFVILNGYRRYTSWKNNNKDCVVGDIEKGRPLDADRWLGADEKGAHAYGYNSNSIGICLIHENQPYSEQQVDKAVKLIAALAVHFDINIKDILGHYEVDSKKPVCPGVEMNWFRGRVYDRIKTTPKENLLVFAKQFLS